MKSMRSFFAMILVLGAVVALIATADAMAGEHVDMVAALLAGLIAAITISAGYIGAVLDDNFDRIAPPRPKAQVVQPPTQGHAQQ